MTLTHTFTQTHRHFIDDANQIDVKTARNRTYPLMAECGEVWIPGPERESRHLPMCPDCEALHARGRRRPQGRRDIHGEPHYVYRLYDADGRLIYVGCTVNPIARMDQHRKNSWWYDQSQDSRLIVFTTRAHALAKEAQAIAEERPRWNKRGRWPNRLGWEQSDYRDYHTALINSGSSQTRHIAKVVDEARRRYGLELGEAS